MSMYTAGNFRAVRCEVLSQAGSVLAITDREPHMSEEECRANAVLFAAAPDLLRELRLLVRLLKPVFEEVDVPGLATLNGPEAAIAKAEGR